MSNYYDLNPDERDELTDDPCAMESWELEDLCRRCGGMLTSTDYAVGSCTNCGEKI